MVLIDAEETEVHRKSGAHALTSTTSVGGCSLVVGEGHESCKHSKFWLSRPNLPDLPTAALIHAYIK